MMRSSDAQSNQLNKSARLRLDPEKGSTDKQQKDSSGNYRPFMYIQKAENVFEHGRLCRYCFKVAEDLRRCTVCYRVAYCSAECQKEDWEMGHRTLCKIWKSINKEICEFAQSDQVNRQKRLYFYGILAEKIRTNGILKDQVSARFITAGMRDQMKCCTCIKTPWELDKFRLFIRCEECLAAWWCSEECMQQPEKSRYHPEYQCMRFRTQAAAQHVMIATNLEHKAPFHGISLVTSVPQKTFRSIKRFVNGWFDYYIQMPEFTKLLRQTETKFANMKLHPYAEKGVQICVFEQLNVPFTILECLEDAYPDLSSRTKLCIHVVGAGPREVAEAETTEEILHFLPALKELDIVYIGPRLMESWALDVLEGDNRRFRDKENMACEHCQKLGRSRTLNRFPFLYHQVNEVLFKGRRPDVMNPDFLILPNSGFSEQEKESWAPTLKHLIDSGVPTVFTSFTEKENKDEQRELKAKGANIVWSRANRWPGLTIQGAIEPMYHYASGSSLEGFANSYLIMIRGRK